MRGWTWLGGFFGILLATAAARAEGPDGWVITLLWSPEYCKQNIGSKEPQCLQEHYFVLGALKPYIAPGTAPPECSADRLAEESFQRALQTLPNAAELKRLWRTQGACSGLGADEYVIQLERAGRRLMVPEEYRRVAGEPLMTTLTAFKDAFVRDNPGLQTDQIVPRCRGKWLREVHVCVDGNFGFQRCPLDVEQRCPEELRLRPLRRALVSKDSAD